MGGDISKGNLAVHTRRLLSALLLISFFLLVVAYGGTSGFALLGMVVAVISLWEFTRLVNHSPGASRVFAVPGAVALVGVTYLGGLEWFSVSAVLFILLQLSRVVFSGGDMEANFRLATLCLLGVLYVAGPLSLAVVLRGMPGGGRYLVLACGIVWVGDTGAFYIGSHLGRHRLAPRVSPHKSVEGSVGGLAASMAAAWLLAAALDVPATLLSSVVLGVVVGGAGQIGDLIESVIKRTFQVKDTGHLIPGHGGMLDRVDSLLFAIPVFYLWVRAGWI